jgi:dihydropteroate synthase
LSIPGEPLRGVRVMGVLNVTPDSFSDGGRFLEPSAAIEHGRALIAEGADIVDVGGESTRPGAQEVSAQRELARVGPVIEALAAERGQRDAVISVDTSKASVAAAALQAGASFVNDVTALRGDAEMVGVVASGGAECCLMHMLGDPRTMQRDPRYEDVVSEVKSFLEERLAFAVREGVREQQVLLDPGIGFGKTVAHNLELLARLDELVSIGRPIVVGTSRKSFLARVSTSSSEPRERLAGTLATSVLAYERGASVLRVHDVAPAREALEVTAATLGGRWTASSPPRIPTS